MNFNGNQSFEGPFVSQKITGRSQQELRPLSWDELFIVPDENQADNACPIENCPIDQSSSAKKQIEDLRLNVALHKEENKAWNQKALLAIQSENVDDAKRCIKEAVHQKDLAEKFEAKMLDAMSKIQGSSELIDFVSLQIFFRNYFLKLNFIFPALLEFSRSPISNGKVPRPAHHEDAED